MPPFKKEKIMKTNSKFLALLTALVVILGVNNFTTSSAESASLTQYLCYPKKGTPLIKVRSKCKSNERRLTIHGIPGANGAVGQTGASGAAGQTGAAGPEGPAGQAGATGQTGATGETGSVGPAGPEGPAGQTGAAGVDGVTLGKPCVSPWHGNGTMQWQPVFAGIGGGIGNWYTALVCAP